jgi:hypothetical protein
MRARSMEIGLQLMRVLCLLCMGYVVKRAKACGGCLGTRRRGRPR